MSHMIWLILYDSYHFSLINWNDKDTSPKNRPEQSYRNNPDKQSVMYGKSHVNSKLDELRRRLEHQNYRIQYTLDNTVAKPCSPPMISITRGVNATREMIQKGIQRKVSDAMVGTQHHLSMEHVNTQTPVPTFEREVLTGNVMIHDSWIT